jgi:hypothetical protein
MSEEPLNVCVEMVKGDISPQEQVKAEVADSDAISKAAKFVGLAEVLAKSQFELFEEESEAADGGVIRIRNYHSPCMCVFNSRAISRFLENIANLVVLFLITICHKLAPHAFHDVVKQFQA